MAVRAKFKRLTPNLPGRGPPQLNLISTAEKNSVNFASLTAHASSDITNQNPALPNIHSRAADSGASCVARVMFMPQS